MIYYICVILFIDYLYDKFIIYFYINNYINIKNKYAKFLVIVFRYIPVHISMSTLTYTTLNLTVLTYVQNSVATLNEILFNE